MTIESLTLKVNAAKAEGQKTNDIVGQLSQEEICLSLILYATHFVSIIYSPFGCDVIR